MSLKVACQMDAIAGIDIKGDSTFALLLEAQRRGHCLFHYHADDMAFDRGTVRARGAQVTVRDEAGHHFTLGEEAVVALTDFDVVLLRQDPPFNMAYITSTHLLERVHPETLVVNNPAEVRNAPEKIFVLDFLDLMPPTMVTRSLDDVRAFKKEYRDIIIKPLYGNGGAAVFRLKEDDANVASLVELFQVTLPEPFMVQQFRPEVVNGDKRIILVDGEVGGVLNRVPAEGETRSNLHVGGSAVRVDLSERDREICARLGPHLKERGLLFTGIDVIGDYLTEINVTSPTGLRHIRKLGGPDLSVAIWDAIESKL